MHYVKKPKNEEEDCFCGHSDDKNGKSTLYQFYFKDHSERMFEYIWWKKLVCYIRNVFVTGTRCLEKRGFGVSSNIDYLNNIISTLFQFFFEHLVYRKNFLEMIKGKIFGLFRMFCYKVSYVNTRLCFDNEVFVIECSILKFFFNMGFFSDVSLVHSEIKNDSYFCVIRDMNLGRNIYSENEYTKNVMVPIFMFPMDEKDIWKNIDDTYLIYPNALNKVFSLKLIVIKYIFEYMTSILKKGEENQFIRLTKEMPPILFQYDLFEDHCFNHNKISCSDCTRKRKTNQQKITLFT